MHSVNKKGSPKPQKKIIPTKSEKAENNDVPNSFGFPWKFLLCGLNMNNLRNSSNSEGVNKKWNFKHIIYKKNINVLNVLHDSRKTDKAMASEILSPVPTSEGECIPVINEDSSSKRFIDQTSNEKEHKKLLDPVRAQDLGKKCLIIDLDETLVHSSFKYVEAPDFQVSVDIEGVSHQVYVLTRPFVDEFLTAMGHKYECVLFTASLSKYADPVVDYIDKKNIFRHRLFREACVYHVGSYVKDLSLLGRPLDQIIILDNSPASFLFHPNNAIQISSWFGDKNDTALLDLIPYFDTLSEEPNVPNYLNSNDPLGSYAAVGSKTISTNSNFPCINANISTKNVISQVIVSTNNQNSESESLDNNVSHKQHDDYTIFRGENKKSSKINSSIVTSVHSNYPVVTRKDISNKKETPKEDLKSRHSNIKQYPPTTSLVSAVEITRTNKIQNSTKSRLIISETNQMRKEKFLKR